MKTHFLFLAAAMAFVTLLNACAEQADKCPTMQLACPIAVIEELSDSTFLQNGPKLKAYGDKIYISECYNQEARIIRLDSAFNVELSFGHKGSGPGEFIWLSFVTVEDDTIYALDAAAPKINQYNLDGKFIKSMVFPEHQANLSNNIIVDNKKRICYSLYGEQQPIHIWNPNSGEPEISFGSLNSKCKGITLDSEHYCFVKKDDRSFFAVCKYRPLLLEYDYEGRLLNRIDFSHSKYFKNVLIEAEECIRKNDGSHQIFFNDACMVKDKLYLLTTDIKEDEPINTLFVVDTENDNLNLVNYIALGNCKKEVFYDYFCISNNKIIAFDGISSALHIYDMRQMTLKNDAE
ncbi:MAG: hypothetical protein J6W13_09640 [Salinivirgaceae bacterium]|nr:hypothetical protein [Salinivirgaceae bacterium]